MKQFEKVKNCYDAATTDYAKISTTSLRASRYKDAEYPSRKIGIGAEKSI